MRRSLLQCLSLLILFTACQAAVPEAGATMVSATDGATLLYIPPGEFLMGSTPEDLNADSDELPQHTVYLDAFWIDQT